MGWYYWIYLIDGVVLMFFLLGSAMPAHADEDECALAVRRSVDDLLSVMCDLLTHDSSLLSQCGTSSTVRCSRIHVHA